MSVYPDGVEVRRGATVSPDGRYRYRLIRSWHTEPRLPLLLPFVMLNPSTADDREDDPTIRRCVGFARALGYDGIGVWNLYAWRATKPAAMWAARREGADIVGPDNDMRLRNLLTWATAAQVPVIAAWGAGARPERAAEVMAMPRAGSVMHHLGLTKAGAPRHPLYLAASARPVPLVP